MSIECCVKSRKIVMYASTLCELNADDVTFIPEKYSMANTVFKNVFVYILLLLESKY